MTMIGSTLGRYIARRFLKAVLGVLAMLAERLVLPLGRTELWTRLSAWFVPLYQ